MKYKNPEVILINIKFEHSCQFNLMISLYFCF